MKLNRKWLLAIAMVLSLTMAISGTLAYLTDRDTVDNTFTMGNVNIEIEESYQQEAELAPGVEVTKRAGINNIHKSEDAYVWMVVSVPEVLDDYIKLGWADGLNDEKIENVSISDDGTIREGYVSHLVKYPDKLKANEGTGNLLESITLDAKVDYQDGEYVVISGGEEIANLRNLENVDKKIIVDAFAIQTVGITDMDNDNDVDVDDAYLTYTNQWDGLKGGDSGVVAPDPNKKVAYNQEELQQFINEATEDTTIYLAGDITGNITVPQREDVNITIRGEGETFDGFLLIDGKSAQEMSAGLTIDNVHFTADELPADIDACIRLGVSGDNNTRYTCNVTVQNCTFDVPGAVGVKSYTGGDKNLKIINCTAKAGTHSLVQAKGIDGVLVERCYVYSKNGMNFNNSINVTVDTCTVDVKGYCVRFGESANSTKEYYTIQNSNLKTSNEDGTDAVIVFRAGAVDATLTESNNTLTGTPIYKGHNTIQ